MCHICGREFVSFLYWVFEYNLWTFPQRVVNFLLCSVSVGILPTIEVQCNWTREAWVFSQTVLKESNDSHCGCCSKTDFQNGKICLTLCSPPHLFSPFSHLLFSQRFSITSQPTHCLFIIVLTHSGILKLAKLVWNVEVSTVLRRYAILLVCFIVFRSLWSIFVTNSFENPMMKGISTALGNGDMWSCREMGIGIRRTWKMSRLSLHCCKG